jgi:type IV pilus assembly protein PilN
MIRINLLPFRAARKKENIRRQVSIFFLILFFMSALLVWYNISLNNKTKKLKMLITDTEKELETYNKINKEIAEIKKNLQVLQTKTDIMEELEIQRREPLEILDAMTDIVVGNRMWFKSFKVTEKVQAQSEPARGRQTKKQPAASKDIPIQKPIRSVDIIIKGVALDSKTVADFMTRLESSPLFTNVNLRTLRQATIKGLNLMEFEVNLNKIQAKKMEGQALQKGLL